MLNASYKSVGGSGYGAVPAAETRHTGEADLSKTEQLQLARASARLVEALKGRPLGMVAATCNEDQARLHRTLNNHKPLRLVTALVYMMICFFERPAWCYSDIKPCLAGNQAVKDGAWIAQVRGGDAAFPHPTLVMPCM